MSGQLDPLSDDARRVFQLDPELEREWHELDQVMSGLEAAGGRVQDDLRGLGEPETAWERQAADVVERQSIAWLADTKIDVESPWSPQEEAAERAILPMLSACAAFAAALLLAVVLVRSWEAPSPSPQPGSGGSTPFLGGSSQDGQPFPSGEVAAAALVEFRWFPEDPGVDDEYRLEVFGEDGDLVAGLFAEPIETSDTFFVLTPAARAALPARFSWMVSYRTGSADRWRDCVDEQEVSVR